MAIACCATPATQANRRRAAACALETSGARPGKRVTKHNAATNAYQQPRGQPRAPMEAPAYQEALHEVNSMLQGFDDLDAPSRRLDVLRTPGPADAFPAAALDSPPRPPPSAVAAAQAPATEDTIRRRKPPSPPLYAWESRTAPGAPRVDHIETHAGVFEATATPGLYAAADIDDDDAARAYVDVQVILTRTEAAEVRALSARRGRPAARHGLQHGDALSRRGPHLIDPGAALAGNVRLCSCPALARPQPL